MGNGVLSAFSQCSETYDPATSVIIAERIKVFAQMMVRSSELRGLFANYVAASLWIEQLVASSRQNRETTDEVETDFTNNVIHVNHLLYELPSGDQFPYSPKGHPHPMVELPEDEIMDQGSPARAFGGSKRKRPKLTLDTRAAFASDSVQLLLCAGLVRPFMATEEYKMWHMMNQLHPTDDIVWTNKQGEVKYSFPIINVLRKRASIDIDRGIAVVSNALGQLLGDGQSMDFEDDPSSPVRTALSSIKAPESLAYKLAVEEEILTVRTTDVDKDVSITPPVFGSHSPMADAHKSDFHKPELQEIEEDLSYFEELLVKTVSKVNLMELTETFGGADWMRNVLFYLDVLPIAIAVADAKRDPRNPGKVTFPLLYVNQAFEKITHYSRAEVLGKNCRFLQSEERTEMHQVHHLIDALREARPVKVGITNVRKNGEAFLNLLAMRPVLDAQEGAYSRVLAVLYDLSQPHANLLEDLEAVDAMLRLLPLVLA